MVISKPDGPSVTNTKMTAPVALELNTLAQGDSPVRRRDGCTECRRKKVKCDLQKPVCSRCTRFPRGCSYDLSIITLRPQRPKTPRRTASVSISKRNTVSHKASLSPCQSIHSISTISPPTTPIYQPTINLSPFLLSDESRFLMHIFGAQTSKMLFPAAPELFLQRMISAAMETPHLLYALLAAACSHHSRLIKDSTPHPKVICLKYTNMAISNLREALQDPTQSLKAETVTTAMTLCTNDVCNGNMHVWRTHLRGVLRLLVACLRHQRESYSKEDPFLLSLAKWFKTMDIIAALSGLDGECIHDTEDGLLDRGSILGSDSDFIDDICGYSLDLIPYMARISQMVRPQNTSNASTDINMVDMSSIQTVNEAKALESDIASLIDKPISESLLREGEVFITELRSTHLAFVHSTLLHLHRRVQLLPINHVKVRIDIRNILDAIGNIDPKSTANILILWPVFSAGCETTIHCERDMVRERMSIMENFGMGNFTRTRDLLERYWASQTDLRWDEYFATLGLELVLF